MYRNQDFKDNRVEDRGKDPTLSRCLTSDCMMWVCDTNKTAGYGEFTGHCGLTKVC